LIKGDPKQISEQIFSIWKKDKVIELEEIE